MTDCTCGNSSMSPKEWFGVPDRLRAHDESCPRATTVGVFVAEYSEPIRQVPAGPASEPERSVRMTCGSCWLGECSDPTHARCTATRNMGRGDTGDVDVHLTCELRAGHIGQHQAHVRAIERWSA